MVIIPARVDSYRFPKKILAKIDNTPMVIKTAQAVKNIDEVVIATDSYEVIDIAKRYNFKAILTDKNHKSGTDRINEAASKLGLESDEIIINVQADEPFIEEDVVKKVYELTNKNKDSKDILINSAYKIIDKKEAINPNIVKVVLDSCNMALYFSRSLIPYPREEIENFKGHLGIYGFTKKSLEKFCSLKSAPLEDIEKLEQLRALYHGYKIAMVEVESKSIGIDTVEDLERALRIN